MEGLMKTRSRPIERASNTIAYGLMGALLSSGFFLFGCLSIIPALAPGVDAEENISVDFPYESRYVTVYGSRMHYVESGQGKPIVLLHGNPTSVYLWRNIIPALEDSGRVIAVDLIGMGKSDKPNLEYTFEDHVRYFQEFMRVLKLKDVTLVLHDWGGGIGFDYAANNLSNVRGVAFMEAVVRPMDWSLASPPQEYLFRRFRDPADGHQIIAEENYFVEKLLPMLSGRELEEEVMNRYREPFPTVESRKPVAMWPRELPFLDEKRRNVDRIQENYNAIKESRIPLLLLHAEPGAIFNAEMVEIVRREIPRLKTVNVGGGIHYLQESQPTAIGRALASWMAEL